MILVKLSSDYHNIKSVGKTNTMFDKHIFFWKILLPPVRLFLRIKFGYTYDKAKDLPENEI